MVTPIFELTGQIIAITGAAGLLGRQHAAAVCEAGGVPVLLDVDEQGLAAASAQLGDVGYRHAAFTVDLTSESAVKALAGRIRDEVGLVSGLVNNVAANPPMDAAEAATSRMETYPLEQWDMDLSLGLTTAFLCAREFGQQMVEIGGGSIVNIASDLAVIAPDQRIYRQELLRDQEQPVKPVTYAVTKAGLLGLTRYLATYWTPVPVRCNALLPGSVRGTQSSSMVAELETRIPLGRLARPSEYKGGLVFLLSEASAYMTGSLLIMDGGRTAW